MYHVTQVRKGGMNRELHRMFDRLSGRTTTFVASTTASSAAGSARADGLVAINPSRFQVKQVKSLFNYLLVSLYMIIPDSCCGSQMFHQGFRPGQLSGLQGGKGILRVHKARDHLGKERGQSQSFFMAIYSTYP